MRGKLKGVQGIGGQIRITPAHAGKTIFPVLFGFLETDHPRACGENLKLFRISLVRRGSPPRMRGKQTGSKSYHAFLRITPAHAGKTRIFVSVDFVTTDHPRACGENQ